MNSEEFSRSLQYEDTAAQNFQRIRQHQTPKRGKFVKKRGPIRLGIKQRRKRRIQW